MLRYTPDNSRTVCKLADDGSLLERSIYQYLQGTNYRCVDETTGMALREFMTLLLHVVRVHHSQTSPPLLSQTRLRGQLGRWAFRPKNSGVHLLSML